MFGILTRPTNGPQTIPRRAASPLDYLLGNVTALVQLAEQLKPVQDQNSIDHRLVVTAMNTIANAERKAGLAVEALKGLPDRRAKNRSRCPAEIHGSVDYKRNTSASRTLHRQ